MGYGDEILAAGQAEAWWASWGESSVIVDRQHRPRWHPIWQDNPAIVEPDRLVPERWLLSNYHTITNGPSCRPYIVYPFTEDTGWTFNKTFHARDYPAKIYLTDHERDVADRLAAALNRPFILIEPWSKHPNLRWPIAYWAQLVMSRPDLTFVQHVHAGTTYHDFIPGCVYKEATFREACALAARSALYVRGESGMCHAAAALGVPQVTIWGGCMDWDVLGGYDKQFGIVSENGPCGRYRACLHCERMMRDITPPIVAAAITRQLELYGRR